MLSQIFAMLSLLVLCLAVILEEPPRVVLAYVAVGLVVGAFLALIFKR